MNRWFNDPGAWTAAVTLKAADISTMVGRILSLSGCNLLFGLVVSIVEKKNKEREKWIGNWSGKTVPGKTGEKRRFV